MATATDVEPTAPSLVVGGPTQREYHCDCGNRLRVWGLGRHRVYFETAPDRLGQPVIDRACPQCGRGLPGKNRP